MVFLLSSLFLPLCSPLCHWISLVILVKILFCNPALYKYSILTSTRYSQLINACFYLCHNRSLKICVFLQYIISVIHFLVNIRLNRKQNIHNRHIIFWNNRLFICCFSSKIFFPDSFMNPCKFRIAIIFSQQNRVFFCNSSSFFRISSNSFPCSSISDTLLGSKPCCLKRSKNASCKVINSGSSGSIFWVKARTVFYTFLLLRLYHRRFSILPRWFCWN